MKNVKEDYIQRYLYDVVRKLPEAQRKDIEKELRSLIEDMLEERCGEQEDEEKVVKEILEELGDPAKLAARYRDSKCLIGGEYYSMYCTVVKIVLICTGAGILISNLFSAFVQIVSQEDLVSFMNMEAFQIVQNDMFQILLLPFALIEAFGMVTLIFAIMEKKQVKLTMEETKWNIEKLPTLPVKKAVISRSDSICGIVFGILAVILFTYAPQFMGFWYRKEGEMVSVPFFNLKEWGHILPLFLVCFFLGILTDFVKLFAGRYTRKVMWISTAAHLLCMAVTCVLFKGCQVLNPEFISGIQQITGQEFNANQNLLRHWSEPLLTNIILGVILLVNLLEIGNVIYHTIRYADRK